METPKFNLWEDIKTIIENGFNEEGLSKLEEYGRLYDERKIVYKRFSPQEQHGCSAGGGTHVIASLLTGAESATSGDAEESVKDFKRESELAQKQIEAIKRWAIKTGVWFPEIDSALKENLGDFYAQGGEADVFDNGSSVVKSIGLDYFIQPIYALDRITLHNTWFPETRLLVLGFGEDKDGRFKIMVEQPFIQGFPVSQEEINNYMASMGFKLKDSRSWTYYTPEIYLSDMHDENVLKSSSGTFFVIDCDIRINSPILKSNGTRLLNTDVELLTD